MATIVRNAAPRDGSGRRKRALERTSPPETRQEAQGTDAEERRRREDRRLAADVDAGVAARRREPRRREVTERAGRVSAGVEPHAQHAEDERQREERDQHLPSAAVEAHERRRTPDDEDGEVRERYPGAPRLAQ